MAQSGSTCIGPRMTVLDSMNRYRATEAVFKAWNSRAGECICCRALFDTLQQITDRRGLNLEQLTAELNTAANLPAATRE